MRFLVLFIILSAFPLGVWSKYTVRQCKDLKVYLKYLETAKPGTLERHPKCNAFAIRSAQKSTKNQEFWVNYIEPAYRKYFGHPSAVFRDCPDCGFSAPIFNEQRFKKVKRDYIFVLSIDGGGVKGLIPARILQRIEKASGTPITDIFDVYVGTSTGGLIALFLTASDHQGRPQYSVDQLVEMYKTLSKKIFKKSSFFSLRGLRSKIGLTSSYSVKPYEQLLKKYFSNRTIQQAIRPVLVTSIDMQNKTPVYFSSLVGFQTLPFVGFMWEAARATSAAPFYFKPLHLSYKNTSYLLADGGVGINNPSLLGILMAKKMYPNKRLVVLSLGTNTKTKKISFGYKGPLGGGILSFSGLKNIRNVVDNLMSIPSMTNHSAVKAMVEEDQGLYFRIESDAKEDIEMDDASPEAVQKMEIIAANIIKENKEFRRLMSILPSFIRYRKKINHRQGNVQERVDYFEGRHIPL